MLSPIHSGSSTKRERRIILVQCQNQVLVSSGNCTEKMEFGASRAFGRGFGFWFHLTRGALDLTMYM
jgi:hypothetical protein